MCEALTSLFVSMRVPLRVALHASYPRASAEDVDDALSDAYAELLARSPLPDLRPGLFYVAAWRRLRGTFRRHSRRLERPTPPAALTQACAPGQELSVDAGRWRSMLERIVEAHGGPHAARLEAALLDKLGSGDSDVAVAHRHGLRRERVNRAWRALIDGLFPN